MKDVEYDHKSHAGVTLSVLVGLIHSTAVGLSHEYHKGIFDVPIRRWREGVLRWPPRLPLATETFKIEFSLRYLRSIGKQGVELEGLKYCDENLELLKRNLGQKRDVVAFLNPEDVRHIFIYDPVDREYVKVGCLRHFNGPISLFLWRVLRAERKILSAPTEENVQTAAAALNETEYQGEKARVRAEKRKKAASSEDAQAIAKAQAAKQNVERQSPPTESNLQKLHEMLQRSRQEADRRRGELSGG